MNVKLIWTGFHNDNFLEHPKNPLKWLCEWDIKLSIISTFRARYWAKIVLVSFVLESNIKIRTRIWSVRFSIISTNRIKTFALTLFCDRNTIFDYTMYSYLLHRRIFTSVTVITCLLSRHTSELVTIIIYYYHSDADPTAILIVAHKNINAIFHSKSERRTVVNTPVYECLLGETPLNEKCAVTEQF